MSKMNIGRILLGIFYLIASFFNLTITMSDPQPLWDYFLQNSHLVIYTVILEDLIIPNELFFLLGTVVFEIIVGVLILSKSPYVQLGIITGIIWVLFLIPMLSVGPEMLTNIILAGIQAVFLFGKYETTAFNSLTSRIRGSTE